MRERRKYDSFLRMKLQGEGWGCSITGCNTYSSGNRGVSWPLPFAFV